MKVSTFSIVIGTKACNARCPFCISRLTGFGEVAGLKREQPIGQNFATACQLAEISGTTTVLFTGKGEPTLYPGQITQYLEALAPYRFPFKELQTNALSIGRAAAGRDAAQVEEQLKAWRRLGLNTMAISVAGVDREANASVYHPDYPDLAATVDYLHRLGYTIRLSVMMMKGLVDSPRRVAEVVDWCRERRVEQLTVRPIRKPEKVEDTAAGAFVSERGLEQQQERDIIAFVQEGGTPILSLSHGAMIYDLHGQNVCLTDCLTVPTEPDQIRTLIYYQSGRVAYHWQYPGATLLGGTAGTEED